MCIRDSPGCCADCIFVCDLQEIRGFVEKGFNLLLRIAVCHLNYPQAIWGFWIYYWIRPFAIFAGISSQWKCILHKTHFIGLTYYCRNRFVPIHEHFGEQVTLGFAPFWGGIWIPNSLFPWHLQFIFRILMSLQSRLQWRAQAKIGGGLNCVISMANSTGLFSFPRNYTHDYAL